MKKKLSASINVAYEYQAGWIWVLTDSCGYFVAGTSGYPSRHKAMRDARRLRNLINATESIEIVEP